MKPKHKRLRALLMSACIVGLGFYLILSSFSEHLIYFYTPSDVTPEIRSARQTIRLGGLVKVGSVEKDADKIHFIATDLTADIAVHYRGALPHLFAEGQGVIAEGVFDDAGEFRATTILAKHDENYLPAEVVEKLKASGQWRDYSPENLRQFSP